MEFMGFHASAQGFVRFSLRDRCQQDDHGRLEDQLKAMRRCFTALKALDLPKLEREKAVLGIFRPLNHLKSLKNRAG